MPFSHLYQVQSGMSHAGKQALSEQSGVKYFLCDQGNTCTCFLMLLFCLLLV